VYARTSKGKNIFDLLGDQAPSDIVIQGSLRKEEEEVRKWKGGDEEKWNWERRERRERRGRRGKRERRRRRGRRERIGRRGRREKGKKKKEGRGGMRGRGRKKASLVFDFAYLVLTYFANIHSVQAAEATITLQSEMTTKFLTTTKIK
jgi:hypothetical protein